MSKTPSAVQIEAVYTGWLVVNTILAFSLSKFIHFNLITGLKLTAIIMSGPGQINRFMARIFVASLYLTI